jgi:hypothetical protein
VLLKPAITETECNIVFWRKFKLDWSYAIGELFIVTIGVLIALTIGEWNSGRLERAEEFDVLSRLISDVEVDLQEFDFRLKAINAKEESLLRVQSAFSDSRPQHDTEFLRDIIIGADFGWNQGFANRATFDDLLGSGRLAVISDGEVRALISAYYKNYKDSYNRIEERETEYPNISYQLLPRSLVLKKDGIVDESYLESGLVDEYIGELVNAVLESSIGSYVIAEINLAHFIRGTTEGVQARAVDLIARLKKYQAEIE